jgi:hypothetical protein
MLPWPMGHSLLVSMMVRVGSVSIVHVVEVVFKSILDMPTLARLLVSLYGVRFLNE